MKAGEIWKTKKHIEEELYPPEVKIVFVGKVRFKINWEGEEKDFFMVEFVSTITLNESHITSVPQEEFVKVYEKVSDGEEVVKYE